MNIEFTDTQDTYLKEIEEKLTSNLLAAQVKDVSAGIQNFWKLLQTNEQLLIDKNISKEQHVRDAEYTFALYILNNRVPKSLTKVLKTHYRMPISALDYDMFITNSDSGGILTSKGSLEAISECLVLDPEWFISLLQYIYIQKEKHIL